MKTYIDFVSENNGVGIFHYVPDDNELREIGQFTRENILRWMNNRTDAPRADLGVIQDFHAVCGDIDIPWATEEAKQFWEQHCSLLR